MHTFFYITASLFVAVCLLLILLILIQKGRGGGLSSSFGGGAGGHTAFGSKTGDALTWATSILFAFFIVLAVGLNLLANEVHRQETGMSPNSAPATRPAEPGTPSSSLPQAPRTPEPAAKPTDDGVAEPTAKEPAPPAETSVTAPTTAPGR